MPEFTIRITITGAADALAPFRQQFINSFPIVEKDSPTEIITVLSGGDLDPRPTLLSLSCDFPELTFAVREFLNYAGENMLSDQWKIQDGEVSRLMS